MAIALDGPVVTDQVSATNILTTSTLGATNATDTVVVEVFLEDLGTTSSSAVAFVNTVAGTGLFFTRKSRSIMPFKSIIAGGTGYTAIEHWWAPTSAAFTGTISVSLNKNVDDWNVHCYCLKGVGSIQFPWDSNVTGLPTTLQYPNPGGPSSTAQFFTTFNTTDWAIASYSNPSGVSVACQYAGTAATSIASVANVGGVGAIQSQTYIIPLTSNMTNATVNWSVNPAIGNVGGALYVIDAVTTSQSGTPPPYVPGIAVVG